MCRNGEEFAQNEEAIGSTFAESWTSSYRLSLAGRVARKAIALKKCLLNHAFAMPAYDFPKGSNFLIGG
jgi:hypothetical protein